MSFSPGRGHHGGRPTGVIGEVMGFLNLVVNGEVIIRGLGREGLPINRQWGRLGGLLHRLIERTGGCTSPP